MISAMSNPDIQFKLRLPAEIKARLEEAAEVGGRSLSAEIVYRLEQSFSHPQGPVGRELVSEVLGDLIERGIIEFTEGGSGLMSNLRKRLQQEPLEPLEDIPPKTRP